MGIPSGLGRPCVAASCARPLGGVRRACAVAQATKQPLEGEGLPSSEPGPPPAELVVRRFFDAVNARDVSALVPLLADHVVLHDLGDVHGLACGQLAVARFYTELLAVLPDGAVFVLEDCTSGQPTKAAVMWRMDVDGTTAPCSSGVSFFTLEDGRIAYVRQAPEHTVKLGHSAQSASSRLATGLPLAVGRQLRQAMPAAVTDALQGLASSFASSALLVTGTPPASVVRQLHQRQRLALPGGSSRHGGGVPDQVDTLASSARPALAPPPTAAIQPSTRTGLEALAALQGIWCKDVGASDQASYERALDVWGIQGVQRVTARLIEGMEITAGTDGAGQGAALNVRFLTVIPFFDVVETYGLATPQKVVRRDLRPGHALASLELHRTGVITRLAWGQPVAGKLEERYELSPHGGQTLTITTRLEVAGREQVQTRAVWRRAPAGMTAQEWVRASERQHGSAGSILRRLGVPVP